jgi:PAS domain S-box-containing protein
LPEKKVKNYESDVAHLKEKVKALEKVEAELLESRERYKDLYNMVRLMCDIVPDLIWAKDLDGKFLFTNHAMAKKLLNAIDTQEPLTRTEQYFIERERASHPENKKWHDFGQINTDSIVLENKKSQRFDENGYLKGEFINLDVYKAPFLDEYGNIIGLVGCAHDVTKEKEIESELLENKELFNTLVNNVPDATFILDWDGSILFANQATLDLVGARRDEDISQHNVLDLVHPEYKESIKVHQSLVKHGRGGFFAEYKFRNFYGEDRCVEGLGTRIKFRGRSANLVTLRDITERKKFEKDLKNSINEKEILLQENHHRVKNNLQIISSLLNLQSRYSKDPTTTGLLRESQSRIMALAMIHETLYQSQNIATIDFGEYIKKLCKQLFQTYYAETRIDLNINMKNIYLNIDTAIPCGLIINEIVVNSLKYAFPEYGKGNITITIQQEDNLYQLTVADDGIGMPQDMDPDHTNTLGLKLIYSLTTQIDGNVELSRSHGTKYTINFQDQKSKYGD